MSQEEIHKRPLVDQQKTLSKEQQIAQQIGQLLESAGYKSDTELLGHSIVSLPDQTNNDKMFEEFLKILQFYNSEEMNFKTSLLDKSGRQNYPVAILMTFKNASDIIKIAKEKKTKPRYVATDMFMQNFFIANSITDNKEKVLRFTIIRDMATAFTQYKSWLTIQEAKHLTPEEVEEPSEKIKKGFLGR